MVCHSVGRLLSAGVITTAYVVCPHVSYAQDIPTSVDPAQIEQSLQPPLELAAPPPLALPPKPVLVRPKNVDQYNFDLSSIELVGAQTIAAEELMLVYADRIGSTVTLAEIYDIADQLTALYRRKGFVLSQAIVPQQRIEGGSVRIQIVEGFIDSTEITGIEPQDGKAIQSLADGFTGQKPLRLESFERGLLLINDLPGISASGVVGKSETGGLGAARVQLMTQFDPWTGSVSLNNRGSRQLGPGRLQVSVTRNITELNHTQIGVSGITALDGSELNLVSGYVDTGLRSNAATRIRLSGSVVAAEPDLDIDNFNDLESDSIGLGLTITHPMIRSRLKNVYLDAGVEFRQSESLGQRTATGFGTDTKTRSTEFTVGLRADLVDSNNNVNQAELLFTQGVDGLGASDRRVQAESPDLSYSKISGTLSRLQALKGGFSLLGSVQGQFSFTDNLPASEIYSIGGQSFVRAYDSSERSGENGAAVKLELRFNRFYRNINFNPYGYFDAGIVDGEGDDDSLTAVGAGIRLSRKSLGGYLELGFPLDGVVAAEGDDDARLFGGLSYSF